jgi:hypothetical protein
MYKLHSCGLQSESAHFVVELGSNTHRAFISLDCSGSPIGPRALGRNLSSICMWYSKFVLPSNSTRLSSFPEQGDLLHTPPEQSSLCLKFLQVGIAQSVLTYQSLTPSQSLWNSWMISFLIALLIYPSPTSSIEMLQEQDGQLLWAIVFKKAWLLCALHPSASDFNSKSQRAGRDGSLYQHPVYLWERFFSNNLLPTTC